MARKQLGAAPSASTDAVTKAQLDGKAAASHTHDDRYYTESEVNALLPVKITQSAYNALGSGRPQRLYAIVG